MDVAAVFQVLDLVAAAVIEQHLAGGQLLLGGKLLAGIGAEAELGKALLQPAQLGFLERGAHDDEAVLHGKNSFSVYREVVKR